MDERGGVEGAIGSGKRRRVLFFTKDVAPRVRGTRNIVRQLRTIAPAAQVLHRANVQPVAVVN